MLVEVTVIVVVETMVVLGMREDHLIGSSMVVVDLTQFVGKQLEYWMYVMVQ